jgi:pseudaminic acid cytidylyltransferase
MSFMGNIAIIPARGGSKRIPRKNIKHFLGKPIIVYSIEIALKSNLFDRVIVSTDDKEIATIAKNYGAEVPFLRSEENSTDFASTTDVLLEVIEQINIDPDTLENICCIYPTAPLITLNALSKGLDLLTSSSFDAVFPAYEISKLVFRSFKLEESNRINLIFQENKKKRSQDLDAAYIDAGQWYWIKIQKLKSLSFGLNQGVIIIDEMEAQDIDNAKDWALAEFKFNSLNEKSN